MVVPVGTSPMPGTFSVPLDSSTPPANQSKNMNTNKAIPPIAATISPVRSLEKST
jgi:hypothetical protein